MKKLYYVLFLFTLMCVVTTIGISLMENDVAKADKGVSFVLNDKSSDLPEEFLDNQTKAIVIITRFYEYLADVYGINNDDSVYSVNGICAENHPGYFGGSYLNSNGELILQIKDEYYTENYKETEWYKNFCNIVNSEDFICRPVQYSYKDLIYAISEVTLGNLSKYLFEKGVAIVDARINDYNNVVEVNVKSQDDYEVITQILTDNIFSVRIKEADIFDDIGVYAGEGVLNYSSSFSVACRARRLLASGTYQYGYLTCGHAFSGTSNVYVPNGSGTNILIGVSQYSLQQNSGNADVAFITTNSSTTLYNTICGSNTTLYASYSIPVMGSVILERGDATSITSGIVQSSSYSVTINNILFTDLMLGTYNAASGDSGGIVYTMPNGSNSSYPAGIHKGHLTSTGSFNYSFFTKMSNALSALQNLGSVPVYLY